MNFFPAAQNASSARADAVFLLCKDQVVNIPHLAAVTAKSVLHLAPPFCPAAINQACTPLPALHGRQKTAHKNAPPRHRPSLAAPALEVFSPTGQYMQPPAKKHGILDRRRNIVYSIVMYTPHPAPPVRPGTQGKPYPLPSLNGYNKPPKVAFGRSPWKNFIQDSSSSFFGLSHKTNHVSVAQLDRAHAS